MQNRVMRVDIPNSNGITCKDRVVGVDIPNFNGICVAGIGIPTLAKDVKRPRGGNRHPNFSESV